MGVECGSTHPTSVEGWSIQYVEELGEVQVGKARNKNGVGPWRPYLRVANVFDGYIDLSDVRKMPFTDAEFDRYRLRRGDVLLNEGQSIELVGRCSMYRDEFGGPCAIQNALIRFRAGRSCEGAFAEQLFRWCQNSGTFASIATRTTTIAHLGVKRLARLRVPVPPLPEQRKIAAILSSVDEAIVATQAVIDQVQVVKKGLMQELLTKGLPGRHKKFKQTEIGQIPEEWEVVELDSLKDHGKYTCVGGPFGSSLTSKHYVESGVPVIRGKNLSVEHERFKPSGFVFVTEEKANELRRNLAYPGDVVFTQRGTLGQVGIVPAGSGFERFVVSQSQMKLTVNAEVVAADFIYYYFKSPVAATVLERETVATGVPHINLGILKKWPVPLPPLGEQGAIVRTLAEADERLTSEGKYRDALVGLKSSLMSVLLTGELRVQPEPTP